MLNIPSISELELATSVIVWDAKKKGNLKEFTPRLVRTTLEDQFHLDRGTLDAAEYKSAIKDATKAALREDSKKSPRVEKQTPPVSTKKRKADGTVKGDYDEQPNSKGKGKTKREAEDEDEGSSKKRRKRVPKKKIPVSDDDDDDDASSSPRPKRRQAQKEKPFKSLEHVPTSDMEQDESPQSALKDENPKELTTSSKGKSNEVLKKDTTPKASKTKEFKGGNLPVDDPGVKSESELSVLIDEPRRVSKSKTEVKEAKKPKGMKEAPTLSKDEKKIKRLKSFVVTCGVRKVWSKLFQGLDTPQQIKKLEEILAELGMHGRLTMEQAKAIKKKRELAKELEDVQEFAKAVEAKDSGGRSGRNIKTLRNKESSGSEDEKEESNDDDEESDVAPRRRPMNSRKSISAFLQDQSDDE